MYKVITYYEEDPTAIVNFRMLSRYVWEDHIAYTRNTIISTLADLEDTTDVVNRLLQNQDDIGALMSPFFSEDTVTQFVALLKEHINIAGELIVVAKASQDLTDLQAKWKANGDAIVAFMNEVNPTVWPKNIVAPLWSLHLNLTIKSVVSRLNKTWADDIDAYDENHKCITDFAELYASGIVSQNLENFCK